MKILVVDDSPFYLAMANKYLEEISDIREVYLCGNPYEVVDIIDDRKIDIVIMDLIMPELSGFELLKLIRSNRRYDDIPIIMFTSMDDVESYKKCYELGASDFISKPINVIEFNARIKVAIQTKASSNDYIKLIELTQNQNIELKEINAKLADTKFHLVQSEKMAAIGNLAAGIAHEINNPMGYIASNCDVLSKYISRLQEYVEFIEQTFEGAKHILDPLGIDAINLIQAKAKQLKIDMIRTEIEGLQSDTKEGMKRVTEIVQSLKVFARSVRDEEKDTYNLSDIINQALLISHNEIKYYANVETSVPDDIIIYCNKVQIGQVLINILVNAAQAIKSQQRAGMGTIKVFAETNDEFITIRITDDGPGIPEGNLLKLFDPFFTTKEIGQGTGLGLSISYDIIANKHHGLIEVNSELGSGTVFVITLPRIVMIDEEHANV